MVTDAAERLREKIRLSLQASAASFLHSKAKDASSHSRLPCHTGT